MIEQDRTTVWRLTTHHENPDYALQWIKTNKRIAIGWGRIGDIKAHGYTSSDKISSAIKAYYPDLRNASDGGFSLHDFYDSMRLGDLVIITAKRKRALVVVVAGDYEFKPEPEDLPLGDYQHQRSINILQQINPEDLWHSAGAQAVLRRNPRGTLIKCRNLVDVATVMAFDEGYNPADYKAQDYVSADEVNSDAVYLEGAVRQVVVNAYERNPKARQQCITHHGARCSVCKLDFGERYGQVNAGFIHVHHLRQLSDIGTQYEVDPVADLRPVCPNCHAIIHRRNPPYTIEEVKAMLHGTLQ